jgi:ABC-type multidrug transport system ATPase subunit
MNKVAFSRFSAYVKKDDELSPNLSVVETLTLSARSKLKTSIEEQDADVDRITTELGLDLL